MKKTESRPTVGTQSFDYRGEHYELLAHNSKSYLYERSDENGIVALEVVRGVTTSRFYPTTSEFMDYGSCYTFGFIMHHPDYIRFKHKLDWVFSDSYEAREKA